MADVDGNKDKLLEVLEILKDRLANLDKKNLSVSDCDAILSESNKHIENTNIEY